MDLVAHHGASPSFIKAVAHWAPDSPRMRLVRRGQPVFSTYRELADPAGRGAPARRLARRSPSCR